MGVCMCKLHRACLKVGHTDVKRTGSLHDREISGYGEARKPHESLWLMKWKFHIMLDIM